MMGEALMPLAAKSLLNGVNDLRRNDLISANDSALPETEPKVSGGAIGQPRARDVWNGGTTPPRLNERTNRLVLSSDQSLTLQDARPATPAAGLTFYGFISVSRAVSPC